MGPLAHVALGSCTGCSWPCSSWLAALQLRRLRWFRRLAEPEAIRDQCYRLSLAEYLGIDHVNCRVPIHQVLLVPLFPRPDDSGWAIVSDIRGMEKSIFRFVLRYSTRQQVVILLLTLSSFPFLYYSLELPKQIVNDAIGGQNFPKEFLRFSVRSGAVSHAAVRAFPGAGGDQRGLQVPHKHTQRAVGRAHAAPAAL